MSLPFAPSSALDDTPCPVCSEPDWLELPPRDDIPGRVICHGDPALARAGDYRFCHLFIVHRADDVDRADPIVTGLVEAERLQDELERIGRGGAVPALCGGIERCSHEATREEVQIDGALPAESLTDELPVDPWGRELSQEEQR